MDIYHLNYANENYANAQKENTKSAKKYNVFKESLALTPNDLPIEFKNSNREILNFYKGAGYWLWKPFLILEQLKKINYGDIVFYTDSGCIFIESPKFLTSLIESSGQDIIPFEVQVKESQFTKRDAFVLMDCDNEKYADSNQLLATFIVAKKSDLIMSFFEEYLSYAKNPYILTDLDNTQNLPNYNGFIAHRHDQSIYSLLCKKYSLTPFRDPSQFGNDFKKLFPNSNYPQIIDLKRNRKKDVKYYAHRLLEKLKR